MAGSPAAYVLDCFALLAYLDGEVGMARVRSVLEGAAARRHIVYPSLINLGEVLYITERERGLVEARRTLEAVDQLPVAAGRVARATHTWRGSICTRTCGWVPTTGRGWSSCAATC